MNTMKGGGIVMKNVMNYLKLVSIVLICLSLPMAAMAAIERANSGTNPYGTYPYGMNSYGYSNYGSCGGYGVSPYQQQPAGYCMRWVQGQWVPVQVMMPGRWEYRRVWVPGYPMTLYRSVPGYWQRTNLNGTPDLSVWSTPNGGLYGMPYSSQSGGYFNPQGIWQSPSQ
jgi:hypothetical protein